MIENSREGVFGMLNNPKLVSREEFLLIRQELAQQNKQIVLCHGVYDLLHYGHIEHLEEAKRQGDILVVSVTAAPFVKKGPGRPHFSDSQRMNFLASLEIVDYVLLSEAITVHNIVELVQPNVYVKGQEYENADKDLTGNINSEIAIVEKFGGHIYFTRGMVYSSTKLLNNNFALLPPEVIKLSYELKNKYGVDLIESVRSYVDGFAKLKVLVVGDIIIDEYVFCSVQGLTSKDAVISARYDYLERYTGGALAIARHIASFTDSVTFCALSGAEEELSIYMQEELGDLLNLEIIADENFVTPVKRRFLKRHPQREEYDKLFSINILPTKEQLQLVDYTKLYAKLATIVKDYDLVVIGDYGHGLLDSQSMEILQTESKFLALNCQTNSANYGTNIITKYKRADMFALDEKELRLAVQQEITERENLLQELSDSLAAQYAWLTVGSKGAIGIKAQERANIAAFTLHVKDTVGAGDAFYAVAALAAVQNVPLDIATMLANIAGAIKANLVGNSKAVGKIELLKFTETALNV